MNTSNKVPILNKIDNQRSVLSNFFPKNGQPALKDTKTLSIFLMEQQEKLLFAVSFYT